MKQGIILAAGLGRRMKDITKKTPKSLIQINGKPMLEINIEYMIEAEFDRIIIVVGYMKEKFQYLKDKYKDHNIIFVYNKDFDSSNTISSLFYAKEYLICETYITTADIFLRSNPYIKYKDNINFYLLRPFMKFGKAEWVAILNSDNRFLSVNKNSYEGNSYTGVSHWSKDGVQFIKDKLEKINLEDENERNQYWDELILPFFDTFQLYAKILENNSEIYEFDDLYDIEILIKEQGLKMNF